MFALCVIARATQLTFIESAHTNIKYFLFIILVIQKKMVQSQKINGNEIYRHQKLRSKDCCRAKYLRTDSQRFTKIVKKIHKFLRIFLSIFVNRFANIRLWIVGLVKIFPTFIAKEYVIPDVWYWFFIFKISSMCTYFDGNDTICGKVANLFIIFTLYWMIIH